jgi:hypothetical protein
VRLQTDQVIGPQVSQYLLEGGSVGIQEEELSPEALWLVRVGVGVDIDLVLFANTRVSISGCADSTRGCWRCITDIP